MGYCQSHATAGELEIRRRSCFKRLAYLHVATCLVVFASRGSALAISTDSLELSVTFIVNKADGRTESCDASVQVARNRKQEWWLSLGPARSHAQSDPVGVDVAISCGQGALKTLPPGVEAAAETPYLLANVVTVVKPILTGAHSVEFSLSLKKLSGLSEQGKPRYAESADARVLFFDDSANCEALIPILVADPQEREELGVCEVYLQVRVRRPNRRPTLGVVSVSSSIKGAEVLLDGGVAGTISKSGRATLVNVHPGIREVRVDDSTGDDVRRLVRVEPNRTVLVDLNPPDSIANANPYRLIPLGRNREGYAEYRRERDGAVVVTIPAGEFQMGNDETERRPREHRVHVSEYLIDKTQVTWGQYKIFAPATGTPLPPHEPYWGIHDDHPVVYVTWEEANQYCAWAGGRLPTEAEWEKGARGTDDRMYPWGNEDVDRERAVYQRAWGYVSTDPVGAHPSGASPYGLMDMAGNVWEWCSDWFDDEYNESSAARDPKGPSSGQAHVVRGGSWDSRPSVLSCSCRSWGHRGYREGDFGFRCAMSVPK